MVDPRADARAFDFLGDTAQAHERAHLGAVPRQRVYYLQRCPSQRGDGAVRTRVRDLTPRARCYAIRRRRGSGRGNDPRSTRA